VDELTVAFAGVVAAGVVGVTAPVVNWLVARENRSHERRLAHDARLFERRAAAYTDLLAACQRLMQYVERTEPIWGPGPEPPEPPSDEEQRELDARVGAFVSRQVDEQLNAFRTTIVDFHDHVIAYREARDTSHTTAEHGTKMHAARDEARRKMRLLEATVRDELTRIPS